MHRVMGVYALHGFFRLFLVLFSRMATWMRRDDQHAFFGFPPRRLHPPLIAHGWRQFWRASSGAPPKVPSIQPAVAGNDIVNCGRECDSVNFEGSIL